MANRWINHPIPTEKVCSLCKKNMPVSMFNRRKKDSEYYSAWCKKCTKAYQRNLNYQIRFGITTELYDKMLDEQGGVCFICQRPPKNNHLAVDHDHITGAIRGLLCSMCNIHYEWFINNNDRIESYKGEQDA